MQFSNKAITLAKLSRKLKKSKVPRLKIFNCIQFNSDPEKILKSISVNFNSNVAIRSSFSNEDGKELSLAGKYDSKLNINPKNKISLKKNIISVLKSKKNIDKNDNFFVQDMVKDVSFSGVLLTHNLNNKLRSININYFDGKDTSVVTSGLSGSKSLIYYENNKFKIPTKFFTLYNAYKEITNLTKKKNLDIEFAVDKNNNVHILQVRDLKKNGSSQISESQYLRCLKSIEKKIIKLKKKHYGLYGSTSYFGNMPDWNPAEIIGTKPKPLALSLYRELITDHIWAKNRAHYGFNDLEQFHLMTTFYGSPFVDVRIDFNSWIPKELDEKTSKKLVEFYLKKFSQNKSNQDKVEFEILFTCFTFSTEKKVNTKLKNLFPKNKIDLIIKSLKKINLYAFNNINSELKKLEILKKRQEIIKNSDLYEIDKIYWLVEDCKKFGTLPFAGLARCGFIAIELLNSLVSEKLIDEKKKELFLNSISTVTSNLIKDLNKISKSKFIHEYGHLRPDTYEISSPNYRENYKYYFGNEKKKDARNQKASLLDLKIPKSKIKKLGSFKNSKELTQFIIKSIKAREHAKFIFTKSIDLIFDNLKKFGKKHNIPSRELSYIKINKILDMYFNLDDYNTISNLKDHIKKNKKEFIFNKNIVLPDVICEPKDLYIVKQDANKINFITSKKTDGKIIELKNQNIKKIKFSNCIVCIENADPGYDYIFSKNIKGLITKYGGLNSHMAIRCAELNLPAIIGVGENYYKNILRHKKASINCLEKKISLN